jgi:hypothetical protein
MKRMTAPTTLTPLFAGVSGRMPRALGGRAQA